MHKIQDKLLRLMENQNIGQMTLRAIGEVIGVPNSPQKIKHHIDQLANNRLIKVDKSNGIIERVKSGKVEDGNLIAVPILGSANCGEALCFGEESFDGQLYISAKLLDKVTSFKNIFAVKAVGPSMNKANIGGTSAIVDGDYVIVDKGDVNPKSGDYILSVINGMVNIKRFYKDSAKRQIILVSESTQNFAPIYIHEDDNYLVNGKVVQVFKEPTDEQLWQDASGKDILKEIGPISKEDYNYYENLCSKKER